MSHRAGCFDATYRRTHLDRGSQNRAATIRTRPGCEAYEELCGRGFRT
jgi:hypothetical protein